MEGAAGEILLERILEAVYAISNERAAKMAQALASAQ
jgi:hypothetical protein